MVSSLTYDDLGRVTSDSREEIGDAVTYAYDLHGWPTGISSPLFTEQLNYASGPGTARYNGDISSQLWQAADSVLRGYKFTYNTDDMLAYAYYGEGSDIDTNTGRYNEHSPAYTPDNAITRIRRNAKRNNGTYGMVDNLYYSYDGVHPTNIRDASTSALSYTGAYEYKNLHGDTSTPDFTYNTAGLLTSDLDKGITRITYNDIGLTDSVRFSDNTVIRYIYSMTGEKLRVTRTMDITHTAPIIDDPIPFDPSTAGTLEPIEATQISEALILDDTEYLDADFTITQPDGTCTYYFGTGYIKQDGLVSLSGPGQTPVQSPPQYFYYTKDHLGNIRSVVTKNPSTNAVTEVQRTHYYPYGGIIADISTGQNIQSRLYNGKELDRTNNLFWYDFLARPYDPTRGQFTNPDLLAEKFYKWNPWVYCKNNPINRIDPDGRLTIEVFTDIYNIKGHYIGTDGISNGLKMVIQDKREARSIAKSKTNVCLSNYSSGTILPSDKTLNESLKVLERTIENGGFREECSIVMTDGSVVQGETGEMPTIENGNQTATINLPILPEGKATTDVEATIHSHLTSVQRVDNILFPQSANSPSDIDKKTFLEYNTNIIVGPLGIVKGKNISLDDIYNRKNGIVIYNRLSTPQIELTRKAVQRIIKQ